MHFRYLLFPICCFLCSLSIGQTLPSNWDLKAHETSQFEIEFSRQLESVDPSSGIKQKITDEVTGILKQEIWTDVEDIQMQTWFKNLKLDSLSTSEGEVWLESLEGRMGHLIFERHGIISDAYFIEDEVNSETEDFFAWLMKQASAWVVPLPYRDNQKTVDEWILRCQDSLVVGSNTQVLYTRFMNFENLGMVDTLGKEYAHVKINGILKDFSMSAMLMLELGIQYDVIGEGTVSGTALLDLETGLTHFADIQEDREFRITVVGKSGIPEHYPFTQEFITKVSAEL